MGQAKKVCNLRIIYDVDGWAFHNRALALQKYCPPDFAVSIASIQGASSLEAALGNKPVDIVFLMDRSKLLKIRSIIKERGWEPKIIANWSNGWPVRLPYFYHTHKHSDLVLINNRAYWEMAGELPGTYFLPNGVDLDIFRVTRPIAQREPRVLWVGSEKRRRLKGYDDLILPLGAKLAKLGIECDFHLVDSFGDEKLSPEEMAEWYNSGTILVVASETEGTPNPALEAAACGCTIVSTPVGNMPDLIRKGVNGYIVDRNVEALRRGVLSANAKYPKLAERMQRDIAKWSWESRSAIFFNLLRKFSSPSVKEWRHSKHGPTFRPHRRNTWADREGKFAVAKDDLKRPDLSHALTVFVTSVGRESFGACLSCLEQQDIRFRLDILEYVAPLSEAFRQMLSRCQTPFFVQVDEDMLLYPTALRTLYESIIQLDPSTAIHAGAIHDVHLGRLILGVKIFKHSIVKDYRPTDVEDWAHVRNAELVNDGFLISRVRLGENRPERARALGCHGAFYSDETIYERYERLQRRRRVSKGSLRWFEAYPQEFLTRFLDDPSELNYFALMGVVAGTLEDAEQPRGAINYRMKGHVEGYKIAQELFNTLHRRRTRRLRLRDFLPTLRQFSGETK